jgi:hypothetical protein
MNFTDADGFPVTARDVAQSEVRFAPDSEGTVKGLNTQIAIAMDRKTSADIASWRVGWQGWPEHGLSLDEIRGKVPPPAWARNPEAAKPEPPQDVGRQ